MEHKGSNPVIMSGLGESAMVRDDKIYQDFEWLATLRQPQTHCFVS
jgi:hypothetical protein